MPYLCQDGPLTIQMSMYGGFEQVGPIGQSLPENDSRTTTQAGDIVLYVGNQIVVFYGSNSWAYTRLGHITDKSTQEMAEPHCFDYNENRQDRAFIKKDPVISFNGACLQSPWWRMLSMRHFTLFIPETGQLMGNLFEQSLFIFFDIVSMMFKDAFGITDYEMEMRHRNIE